MSLKSYFSEIFSDISTPIAIDLMPKPRPRLASATHAPGPEEYEAWRDDAVTQFVFLALRRAAKTQEEAWLATSWDSGEADELALTTFRVRADAYLAVEEAMYSAICEMAGVEEVK